ncbi:unnamed protein product [Bemisia tabaci]|uniref:Diphosphomevalonate decarboxylase n=2 Tax=Bemisia tabaci TaxID=7038 RepID=A0A9P0A9F6_BEMTA|nr:unnamed protein product [Bemisia tabaci]
MDSMVTCIAPVNIAVIKYWGKRDEKLILPLNDSVSGTLSTDQMHAKTTVMRCKDFTEDKIWLNGKEVSFSNPRLLSCMKEIRRLSRESGTSEDIVNTKVHICSENNFPTAAGLASSAAGYACLVFALKELFGVKQDITRVARLGSGSACRSIYGGFVRWHKGDLADGSDSIATQIAPPSHWPLHVFILVVNDKQKKIGSTPGMQRTALTSELVQYRIKESVPKRIEDIIQAVKERNFDKFAEITMKDSNQFHAVCLDTYPPNIYMNDISHEITSFVHTYNELFPKPKVAYTFDAGPNACIYLEEESVPDFAATLQYIFPPEETLESYFKGESVQFGTVNEGLRTYPQQSPGLLKYIIHTKIGDGPKRLDSSEDHLLTLSGVPVKNGP